MKRILAILLCGMLLLSACSGPALSESSSVPAEESQSASSAVQTVQTAPSASSQSEPPTEAADSPAPNNDWQFDVPENHEMDPAVLEGFHTALSGSKITSAVTVKDGVIIDEYYAEGYDENSLFPVHSASKSFTGALIGIAVDEGYIDSIDDPLSEYLPRVTELPDTRKQQITLRHLLTHTSGLEWYEWGGGYSNWEEFRSAENWVEYILNRDLVQEPGAVFNYSTGNTHLLSAALEAATGMSQEEYCRTHLFEPMGISEDANWYKDGQGVTDGGNGLSISSRDAAKFGQLFLNGGSWNGEQLIPAEWVEESTSVQNPGPGGTGQYGYQWWIRTHTTGEYGTHATPYETRSFDTYFAFGYGGQFIYVVPELKLVTVFTCRGNNSYAPRPFFTDYVLNAYTGTAGEA